MMPTVNKVIWPLLEVPEEKVIRIVYAGTEKIIEREKKEREEKEKAYEKIRLTENDMKWNDLYILFESAKTDINRKDVTLLYIGVRKMEVSQDLFGVYYTSRTDSYLLMKNPESGEWE